MTLKLVIFDWDGTLMDSTPRIVDSMQSAARDCDINPPSQDAVHDVIGLGLKEAGEVLFPALDEELKALILDRYRYHYIEGSQVQTPMFPGAIELLVRLKAKGLKMAVATGKSRAGLERAFKETDLGHYFDSFRCADMTTSKPAPDMVNELLTEFDLTPEEAVVVGDSVHDVEMAVNANVTAIGVTYGAQRAEKLKAHGAIGCIRRPLELMEMISLLM